jgi:hypothetical protein
MSRWLPLVVGVSLVLRGDSIGLAQSTYPTVYGSTGTPYGPTQAEYQYRRQYGRPWHGYGGQVSPGPVGGNYVVPGSFGYPSYYGCHHAVAWGQPVYVNVPFSFGYSAPGPFIYGIERLTNPSPFISNALPLGGPLQRHPAIPVTGPDLADGLGPIQPLDAQIDPSQRPVARASAAARLKSLEKQAFGDEQLRKQQWAKAYVEYRAAVDAAPDQADAHYHLGFLFVAMQHYASAVREFKRAIFLDPTLPQTGEKMAVLFGPDSQILRTSIVHKVADWLREDIRDPDRLFLFGLLLHYENDARGREVLEAAQRMANSNGRFSDHIVAFLSPSVEPAAADDPKPDPGLIDLPNLLPPRAVPGRVGPAPANNDNLPPAPLPQAPGPDERLPTLPPLSNDATPPVSGSLRRNTSRGLM